MAKNANLHNAKKVKNDEFYTQLYDVAKELICYKKIAVRASGAVFIF